MTHLFALSAAAADIMNISLRSRLSAARLTYIDSLHSTSRQQSFTASLLLDEAIRLCCPSVPRPLDIAANENGKPYLTAAPDVHFSLSHSAAWAVCAVSDHPVGVDIQQCRSFKPNIADRFFHPMRCSTCPRSRLPSAKTRSTRCGRSRKATSRPTAAVCDCCGSSA